MVILVQYTDYTQNMGPLTHQTHSHTNLMQAWVVAYVRGGLWNFKLASSLFSEQNKMGRMYLRSLSSHDTPPCPATA